jgi:sugar-specific transcriptional regulator TrmB
MELECYILEVLKIKDTNAIELARETGVPLERVLKALIKIEAANFIIEIEETKHFCN